jgi:predicted 3-demethylubiquinone-9 3-methyltransferase (glyoxalase superfamily)
MQKSRPSRKAKQKISPFLWFDKEAGEAANLYMAIFKSSKIKTKTTLRNTHSGPVEIVTAELAGQEFTLMSAGPIFKFNPSVSFLVTCSTKEEVDTLWRKLSDGGKTLLELGPYPFSDRYGWLQDKYGLSWQIMLAANRKLTQKITPTLMFVGSVCGKAEEAIKFYAAVFKNGRVGNLVDMAGARSPTAKGH